MRAYYITLARDNSTFTVYADSMEVSPQAYQSVFLFRNSEGSLVSIVPEWIVDTIEVQDEKPDGVFQTLTVIYDSSEV